jgi:hypothetical protein
MEALSKGELRAAPDPEDATSYLVADRASALLLLLLRLARTSNFAPRRRGRRPAADCSRLLSPSMWFLLFV